MIRPCGPEPWMALRSTPDCSAMRRARGEANTRGPRPEDRAAAFTGTGSDLGAGAGAGSATLAGVGAAAGGGAEAPASPLIRAIGVLTFTPSAPSATSRASISPSSTASTSMVALSVSISAMMSPEETTSPGFTCHLVRVPSSMVGDRAGMRMSVMIGSRARLG